MSKIIADPVGCQLRHCLYRWLNMLGNEKNYKKKKKNALSYCKKNTSRNAVVFTRLVSGLNVGGVRQLACIVLHNDTFSYSTFIILRIHPLASFYYRLNSRTKKPIIKREIFKPLTAYESNKKKKTIDKKKKKPSPRRLFLGSQP